MVLTGKHPNQIIQEKALTKIGSRDDLKDTLQKVFTDNPKCVQDALNDQGAVQYLVGQLMKATRGKADPQLANQMIQEKLETIKNKKTN